MCLILFAYRKHSTYHLVVAANRDEFYARPTAPVHYWEDHPYILAGRDLLKKGTWMGVTKTGRFAALTNYRNPQENVEGLYSRGEVVANFLQSEEAPNQFLENLEQNKRKYPGFNLLVGDQESLHYYSNIQGSPQNIQPGIHGVSNHILNTEWPKVIHGKKELSSIIEQADQLQPEELTDLLLTSLQHAEVAPDHQLPQTGLSIEWERLLSPMFIQGENYGTRSSTVILMSSAGLYYTEKVYTRQKVSQKSFQIKL